MLFKLYYPVMWIERDLTERIRTLVSRFPALLLTGPRQVGKTALLRHTFPGLSFATLDLPSLAEAAETTPGEFLEKQGSPLILDEVQYAPGLFRHMKAAIDADRHRMGRFLMTGSHRFALMQSITESLAGRCAVVELAPLSMRELRSSLGWDGPGEEQVLWRGGFPDLWRDPGLDPRDFFTSYVVTYLERDVRSAMRVGSLRDFERFLRACAMRSGQLLNLADLGRDVGIAATTVRDWISVLQASGLVLLLEPWFGNLGKRLIKAPKLYLRDTGLACFLLGIDSPTGLLRSPFLGPLWEAFVLGELLAAIAAAGSSAKVFFWRDASGTEVDFAIEHQGRVRLVEVKWAEDARDSLLALSIQKVSSLLGDRSAQEHWLLCRTPHAHLLPGVPSVRVMPLRDLDFRVSQ